MKKFVLLILVLFIPCFVYADTQIPINVDVVMEELVVEGEIPFKVQLANEHLIKSEYDIVWYESTDGAVFNELTTTYIDYNKYYKFIIDEEIEVEDGYEINNFTFNGNSSTNLEFVISPFYKYSVTVNLEGLEFEGMNEVVAGERLSGKIIPKRGYRLPEDNDLLQYNLIVSVGGNNLNLDNIYNPATGIIDIDGSMITDNITIRGVGRDIALFEFTSGANQRYEFGSGATLEFIMDADISLFENQGVLYLNGKEVDSTNYIVEEGSTKFIFNDEFVKTLTVGEYTLKAEFYEGEAETTFSVVPALIENPRTSDNLKDNILLLVMSLFGIIMTSVSMCNIKQN